ncbi:hypothetical protein ES703_20542 [subsurface metagenome]
MGERTPDIEEHEKAVNALIKYGKSRYGFLDELFEDIENPELMASIVNFTDWAVYKWKWGLPLENLGKWLEGLKKMKGKANSKINNMAIELYIERLQIEGTHSTRNI